MATNAQVAYQAAALGQEEEREADLTPRATAFFTWLEAQPHDTAVHVGNAQAALLAAVGAYVSAETSPGIDPVNDVTAHATRILADINAHATGQTS